MKLDERRRRVAGSSLSNVPGHGCAAPATGEREECAAAARGPTGAPHKILKSPHRLVTACGDGSFVRREHHEQRSTRPGRRRDGGARLKGFLPPTRVRARSRSVSTRSASRPRRRTAAITASSCSAATTRCATTSPASSSTTRRSGRRRRTAPRSSPSSRAWGRSPASRSTKAPSRCRCSPARRSPRDSTACPPA